MDSYKLKATIMDEAAMKRAVTRIAHEILERNEGSSNIALVGIVTRGVHLARMIADEIEKIEGSKPPIGTLDISFYRDDVMRHIAPVIHATNIPFDIDRIDIVLVDDVLYTGRTIRAGHRELPIRADYVGKNVPSSREEDVRVRIVPIDDCNIVEIWEKTTTEGSEA